MILILDVFKAGQITTAKPFCRHNHFVVVVVVFRLFFSIPYSLTNPLTSLYTRTVQYWLLCSTDHSVSITSTHCFDVRVAFWVFSFDCTLMKRRHCNMNQTTYLALDVVYWKLLSLCAGKPTHNLEKSIRSTASPLLNGKSADFICL